VFVNKVKKIISKGIHVFASHHRRPPHPIIFHRPLTTLLLSKPHFLSVWNGVDLLLFMNKLISEGNVLLILLKLRII
jgi:hypothetical protein